jgi:hypothetical protein
MCSKNSAVQERGEGRTLGAWEGKIKGRSTSSRARRRLHMGFSGTAPLRAVPDATRGDCAAYFQAIGSRAPDGI